LEVISEEGMSLGLLISIWLSFILADAENKNLPLRDRAAIKTAFYRGSRQMNADQR
jgi:hypothetical protein